MLSVVILHPGLQGRKVALRQPHEQGVRVGVANVLEVELPSPTYTRRWHSFFFLDSLRLHIGLMLRLSIFRNDRFFMVVLLLFRNVLLVLLFENILLVLLFGHDILLDVHVILFSIHYHDVDLFAWLHGCTPPVGMDSSNAHTGSLIVTRHISTEIDQDGVRI